MKLKEFVAPEPMQKGKIPSVSIAFLNGRIYFNKPSADLLELTEKSRISFFQNEEKPTEWYFKRMQRGGYPLQKVGERGLQLCKGPLARPILKSMGFCTTIWFDLDPVELNGDSYWKLTPRKK